MILAGERARPRTQSPTIEPGDLARNVEAAGAEKRGARALRDRLLVGVHCHSGLAAREIRTLRWESEAEAWSVAVERAGSSVRLTIFGSAASLMIRHRLAAQASDAPVFHNARGEPLTERQARRIVLDACSAAGFPHATRGTLLSAAAATLSAAGLRDHEVAITLEITDMRTINRLMKPHQVLAARRRARLRGHEC